jgi:hypothetical protein
MNTYNLGATSQPGTDVMILKIFSPIFFAQTTTNFIQNFDHNIGF